MDTGGAKKEATILSLVQETSKLLDDLQNRLDNSFYKHRGIEGESEDKPELPNVLDEIIREAEDNCSQLRSIIAFIATEVLPKIN